MIHSLKQLDVSIKEMQFVDACKQLDKLAPFPEFIECRLADWMPIIHSQMSSQMEPSCHLLYTLCKLLGHRSVIDVYMPCTLDVSDHVIKRYCDFNQDTSWQCRYIYLLWCSCIIRLPFPLSRVSSHTQQLIALSLQQLDTFGPEMHASSILLANYFNRPDVVMTIQFGSSVGHLRFLLEFIKLNPEKQKLDECIKAVIAIGEEGATSPMIRRMLMKIYKRLPELQNEGVLKFCMEQLWDKVH